MIGVRKPNNQRFQQRLHEAMAELESDDGDDQYDDEDYQDDDREEY